MKFSMMSVGRLGVNLVKRGESVGEAPSYGTGPKQARKFDNIPSKWDGKGCAMQYSAVFHVDQNDEKVFNLALNNVINLLNGIPGQEHDLVMLLNGPAVALLDFDNAVYFLERIKTVQEQGVKIQACANALKRFEVDPERLIEGTEVIPAGIVALIDLQKSVFAYIKP